MYSIWSSMRRVHRAIPVVQCSVRFNSNVYSKNVNTNLSHCSGPTGMNLLDITIGKQLQDTAEKYPTALALISSHQKRRVSYEEFNQKVTEVARSLLSLGLPSDAKIGVYAPNCEEWVLIQFACARVGYVLVNINPSYQVSDLAYVLKKVEINTLVMPRFLKTSDYVAIINEVAGGELRGAQDPYALSISRLPDLRQVVLLEDHTIGGVPQSRESDALYGRICRENNLIAWKDFCGRAVAAKADTEQERAFQQKQAAVQIHDPVNIQFTSGTTGLPKGAVLSHYNILNNGYLVGRLLNYNPHEAVKVLIQVPLYHCFGTVMGNLACVSHGATMVYPNGSFDGEQSLRVVEEERISSLYGVPTMFLELMNQQLRHKRDISSLRTGIMAGALCPKALMDRCITELGLVDLTICYGMTELSPVTHQTSPHDTIHKKTSTVGSLLPHTVTKIVDESGAVVPRTVVGEIWTKGYGVMLGYYNDKTATDEAVDPEGYMKTGDLGYIDNDGYLCVEGRKKDTIIRGGENISPKEVEDFLMTHPAVDDVQVINVKDERLGDEICAWVKLKQEYSSPAAAASDEGDETRKLVTKQDILSHCKGKIAHYKIPRYVRFVDSFPLTVTGKQQKFIMRNVTNDIIKNNLEEL